MSDPSAPRSERWNVPGGIPTVTVRNTVEPFGNQDVDDWLAERVRAESRTRQSKSPLGGHRLGTVRDTTAGSTGCR
ncbi:MAG: hypothetical protein ABEH81_09845 [Halopenitus sp.]